MECLRLILGSEKFLAQGFLWKAVALMLLNTFFMRKKLESNVALETSPGAMKGRKSFSIYLQTFIWSWYAHTSVQQFWRTAKVIKFESHVSHNYMILSSCIFWRVKWSNYFRFSSNSLSTFCIQFWHNNGRVFMCIFKNITLFQFLKFTLPEKYLFKHVSSFSVF